MLVKISRKLALRMLACLLNVTGCGITNCWERVNSVLPFSQLVIAWRFLNNGNGNVVTVCFTQLIISIMTAVPMRYGSSCVNTIFFKERSQVK